MKLLHSGELKKRKKESLYLATDFVLRILHTHTYYRTNGRMMMFEIVFSKYVYMLDLYFFMYFFFAHHLHIIIYALFVGLVRMYFMTVQPIECR